MLLCKEVLCYCYEHADALCYSLVLMFVIFVNYFTINFFKTRILQVDGKISMKCLLFCRSEGSVVMVHFSLDLIVLFMQISITMGKCAHSLQQHIIMAAHEAVTPVRTVVSSDFSKWPLGQTRGSSFATSSFMPFLESETH